MTDGPPGVPEFFETARRDLEAARQAPDEERLDLLERMYEQLEGELERDGDEEAPRH